MLVKTRGKVKVPEGGMDDTKFDPHIIILENFHPTNFHQIF